jgi:hypothetical protein
MVKEGSIKEESDTENEGEKIKKNSNLVHETVQISQCGNQDLRVRRN